ncbi:hypothetical protein QM480_09185 [Flectobacillus sp. DC10W]|jgi:hypothetical protein|uniref:Lipocalin-like domain-containing protein n=1 Tax=Flectobacillus longus TaxID=2984207 RepID=A0ABT6YLM8_9BACT|nr:hypothetical protein [Flectobacillus longus]MDI9864497.1 hypothetical protein [Flectobacillus longus]
MKHLALVLVGLLLVVSSSCKKNNVSTKTNTEKLTAKVWMVSEVSSTGGLVVVYKRDLASNGYDLSKVRLEFLSNGTIRGVDNNGNTSTSGTWKFVNNETQIEISGINFAGINFGTITVARLEDANFDFTGTASIPQLGIPSTDATVKMIPAN